jgi:ABC-type transport system involved in cytochrome bd biosynthesis fused ATPase/permease subunit
LDVEYLRSEVNYVNQRTNMFNETVLYNMKYGNNGVSEEKLENLLKTYGLDEVYSDLPYGIRGSAGVNGGNLSGGMQKTIMIIRGILKPGKVIIMDEPLAGLDKKTIEKVMKLLKTELEGRTLIVISHDNAIMPYMDKVIDITKL